MKMMHIFVYEYKHFTHNSFKIIALLLFIIAALFGLYNGKKLLTKQNSEIAEIEKSIEESISKVITWYDTGQKGPADRTWVNINTPFWAIWYATTYSLKKPQPTMLYNIGQAEQFGYYTKVSYWSSPYDANMIEEIANPERLQIGTLDFSFVLLYLLPLLLLILLYDVKGKEVDNNLLNLIYAQVRSPQTWLFSRVSFYFAVVVLVIGLLFGISAWQNNLWANYTYHVLTLYAWIILYAAFWTSLFGVLIAWGSSSIFNALKMLICWILFALVLPGLLHVFIGINKPTQYMTALADIQRDESRALFELPDTALTNRLFLLYPQIKNSPAAKDSTFTSKALQQSASALVNQLFKNSIKTIEQQNNARNNLINSTFWLNPIAFFQNKLNLTTQTHYENYLEYRAHTQNLIDLRIERMVIDTWNSQTVNKQQYLQYLKDLK